MIFSFLILFKRRCSIKSFLIMVEKSSDSPMEFKDSVLYPALEDLFRSYLLSDIHKLGAFKFIKEIFSNPNKDNERAREWVLMKVNKKIRPEKYDDFQKGCDDLCPGISLQGFHDPTKYNFINKLIESRKIIVEELLKLREIPNNGFQPYLGPKSQSNILTEDGKASYAHDKGDWNVFYLFLHNLKFEENCKLCPRTVELIEKIVPRQYCHAFFSAISPGTHIVAHNGPTNRKLRLHIPLVNPEKSRIRVGGETKWFKDGEAVLFDDSFNHEAWNDGDKTRINLILDFWHPELSDMEVKFFHMLQQAKLKNGRKYLEMIGKEADEYNYFDLIEKSKNILKDVDWWVN